eukprot:2504116-Pyramimonas_sp.AAC.1
MRPPCTAQHYSLTFRFVSLTVMTSRYKVSKSPRSYTTLSSVAKSSGIQVTRHELAWERMVGSDLRRDSGCIWPLWFPVALPRILDWASRA